MSVDEGAGTQSRTRTQAGTRTTSRTVSYLITQSEAVAWYLHEDLRRFVDSQQVNLSELLGIPDAEPTHTDDELVELLCDDIAHMLRDGLVRRLHLLVYDEQKDLTSNAYPLLYKATYEISLQRGLSTEGARRRGGLLRPPELGAGRVAILIDWHPDADAARRQRVRYPSYNMNWVAPDRRYDATTLVHYRDGSLTADGAVIVRRGEEASPAALRYLDVS
jgi:hypothetical protein